MEELKNRGWDTGIANGPNTSCDIFVIMRYGDESEVRLLQAAGRKVVVDMNDILIFGPPLVPESAGLVRAADFVVTGNRYMVKRLSALNNNALMIQEALEDKFFDIGKREAHPVKEPFTISWHGTGDNLKYWKDVNLALEKLAKRHDILVKIVTNPKDGLGRSNIDTVKAFPYPAKWIDWRLNSFIEDISAAHMGIAPLYDTEFCRNKGYHKVIGYMALGLPCVASDVAPYREVIKHGETGFLCDTSEDWYKCIEKLILDKNLRHSISLQARDVTQYFKISYVADLWEKLLTDIYEA
jgi:glycosyltransferase involved in cell wall biosynthesis